MLHFLTYKTQTNDIPQSPVTRLKPSRDCNLIFHLSLSCLQYDERLVMFTRIFTLMLVLVEDKKISLYGHNIIL